MEKVIVGNIQGYDVYYIPEKNYVFCKNTVLPLSIMLDALSGEVDRIEVPDKNLVIKIFNSTIDMGCLTATKENLRNIRKTINKIKDCYNNATKS